MARGRPLLIQNSEDRVIGCYPLAVREGRCGAEADMRSSPRREANVLLDDGCPTFDGHLLEPHLAPPTADDVGLALGSDVLYPFTLSEHRHEIVLASYPAMTTATVWGRPVLLPFTSSPTCRRGGSPKDAHADQKRENALPRPVALPLL
jgi:hypothetical protein